MLKKSLIALAIASVAGSAFAADITVTPKNILSKQGAVGTTWVKVNQADSTVEGEIQVVLDAEYKIDDIITLDFTGAKLKTGSTITASVDLGYIVVDADNKVVAAEADDVGAELVGTVTLGVLSQLDNQLTLRVTSLDYKEKIGADVVVPAPLKTTKKGVLTFSGVELSVADILTNGYAKVDYSAKTSTGIALDVNNKTNSTVLFEAKDQFKAEVIKELDSTVDVNEERQLFTEKGTESQFTLNSFEITYDGVPYALAATATKSDFVVNGNFAFIGEAGEDGFIKDMDTFKVYNDRLELTVPSIASTGVRTVTVPGDVIIPHQTFTASAKVSYTAVAASGNGEIALELGDAGQWKLNGAVVHVPYMPFRAGFSPIVNISNVSKQDGGIEVIVYQQDNAWVEPQSYTLETIAKAEAQTNITSELRTLGVEGDVAFDIIVNAPAKDIAVNALYFQGGDRAVINTVDRSTLSK